MAKFPTKKRDSQTTYWTDQDGGEHEHFGSTQSESMRRSQRAMESIGKHEMAKKMAGSIAVFKSKERNQYRKAKRGHLRK